MREICGKDGMQKMKQANQIEDMIGVFEPFPLMDTDDFSEFYVDTYDARGENAVKRMAVGLQYSGNPYMKILFMGHRGSGKSTELFLLKQKIESRFEVISFFIQDEVDPDTMTHIDFIFAIMSQIVKYVEENKKIKLSDEDLDSLYKYWQEEKIIEESEYDSDEMSAGFKAKLSFLKRIVVECGGILKTGSESKMTIRRKIEPKIGYLIQLLNQIIAKINLQLQDKKLIFIIEDLDKLGIHVTNELFIKNRKTLFALQARMILTFPVFMAYDLDYNAVKEDVDMCQMLSIIKVRDQNKTVFRKGVEKLEEIVYKRAKAELFEEAALNFMIMQSGGAIRDLFQMIRDAAYEALLDEREKILMQDARIAYVKLKSEYERLIREDVDVEKLVSVYEQPKPLMTDEVLMKLLKRGLVLEYNGERWCGIHPAVEDFLREKGEIVD